MADTLERVRESLLKSCSESCPDDHSCFASCVDVYSRSRHQRPDMADIEERVKESLAIFCLTSLSSILGALLVIYISRPSIYVSRPWFHGILKSFLAGAVTIVMVVDTLDTGAKVNDSWAAVLGGSIIAGFGSGITSNPPNGPVDATLTEEELHELRKREFDSPRARESALAGGILTAVVIGLRNLAYGIWFFSLVNNSARWMLPFSRTLLLFLAPQFVVLCAAVAVPISRYFGTKCRWRTLLAVAVSSAAFPSGYNIAAFALPSDEVVLKLLEFAGGMMMALTLMYLVPSSCQNAPWRHCLVALYDGIACMAWIRIGTFGMP